MVHFLEQVLYLNSLMQLGEEHTFFPVLGAQSAEPRHPPRMRISLPRHDLLGEERWPISQMRRARSLVLSGLLLGLICIGVQGIHICKAQQSLSGSNDQTIDNIQRTLRAYFEAGLNS